MQSVQPNISTAGTQSITSQSGTENIGSSALLTPSRIEATDKTKTYFELGKEDTLLGKVKVYRDGTVKTTGLSSLGFLACLGGAGLVAGFGIMRSVPYIRRSVPSIASRFKAHTKLMEKKN